MDKHTYKYGISIKDQPSKTAPYLRTNDMATKIEILKQNTLQPKEKEVQTSLHESALLFIQKLFPNKINFSINEAASVLNVSYDFIREHIIRDEIKAKKYGDRWMINLFELIRILIEGV